MMSDRTPWKAIHSWEDDASDEFDPLPVSRRRRDWWSLALQTFASRVVQAMELEKAASESSGDERRRLKGRAVYLRKRAQEDMDLAGESVPPEFNAALYLHRCRTE
jgi:hypothetical protein